MVKEAWCYYCEGKTEMLADELDGFLYCKTCGNAMDDMEGYTEREETKRMMI